MLIMIGFGIFYLRLYFYFGVKYFVWFLVGILAWDKQEFGLGEFDIRILYMILYPRWLIFVT